MRGHNRAVNTSRLTRRQALAGCVGLGALLARPAHAQPEPRRRPWPAGRATPALELPDLDGRPWRLQDQRGRVVALNFWASWCEPCRSEMPSLELMAQRHEGDGLVVIGVNHREGVGTIRRFLQMMPVDLPLLRDADGSLTRAFGVGIFPSTVFIGRDGRVLFTVVGEADWGNPPARGWVAALL